MKHPFAEKIINFLIRAVLGLALIFFINQFLEGQSIPAFVGLNLISFLAAGFLGIPGIGLMYGMVFFMLL